MIKFQRPNFIIANMRLQILSLIFFASVILVRQISAHGRLIEPPSRASMWRYGFDTPHDYNDHECYCGGFTRQWQRNKGKCGICGDAWDAPTVRHEFFIKLLVYCDYTIICINGKEGKEGKNISFYYNRLHIAQILFLE